MKYKVGDLVEFSYSPFECIGKIVETDTGQFKDAMLIELPNEYKGQGHKGEGNSKKEYKTDDYWFIREKHIIRKVEREMKLSDLRAGKHVIEIRSGEKFLVVKSKNKMFGICLDGRHYFSALGNFEYYDDLTSVDCNMNNIVKIYEIDKNCTFDSLENNLNLIWERKEPKKMTVSEICKELGYEVEIIKEK